MPRQVINIKEDNYDVYVGRGSNWGNPFMIGRDGTREQVIKRFIAFYKNSHSKQAKFMRDNIHTLKGKVLGCHCYPQRCHGDYLARKAMQKWKKVKRKN